MDSGAARFLEKTRLCVHGLFLSTVHNKHLIQNWYEQGEPDVNLAETSGCPLGNAWLGAVWLSSARVVRC